MRVFLLALALLGCSVETANWAAPLEADAGDSALPQLELGQACVAGYACAPLGAMRPEGVMGEPACEGMAANDAAPPRCTILCDHQLPSPDEACQELADRAGYVQGRCLEGEPGRRVCHFR